MSVHQKSRYSASVGTVLRVTETATAASLTVINVVRRVFSCPALNQRRLSTGSPLPLLTERDHRFSESQHCLTFY